MLDRRLDALHGVIEIHFRLMLDHPLLLGEHPVDHFQCAALLNRLLQGRLNQVHRRHCRLLLLTQRQLRAAHLDSFFLNSCHSRRNNTRKINTM